MESAAYTTVLDRLDEGTLAILAVSLLFVLPVDWSERRFTLNWDEAVVRALRHRVRHRGASC